MATDKNPEADMDTPSNPSLAQTQVGAQYLELLEAQKSDMDKVFISGYSLRQLDDNLVVLDEEAFEHPRTWPLKKKVMATIIIGAFCFISPFASTIFAPSVHLVSHDLGITSSTAGALTVSIFLFAYAIGPLFLAPLSEIYGRIPVLHAGNFFFVVFSIGAGFAHTPAQFFTTRFISGVGGSASISIVGGYVADIWDIAQRPKAAGLVMLGPVLGPVIGPVCGGWMSQGASWRWTLWIPAIASTVIGVLCMFTLSETYAPQVLRLKVQKLRKSRSDDNLYSVLDISSHSTTGFRFLLTQAIRPLVYLAVDPALLFASIFYSVVFGIVYLVIVTLGDVFGRGYGHSVGIVGTDFLSCGVGMIIGTIGTIKAMEAIFKRDVTTGKMNYQPESRLLSCIVGIALMVGGLFMYGFSATRTHFIVPLIGITIFTAGCMNVLLAIQLYSVDGFEFPASAFAAISVLRCLFAGAFPLFGPKLFESLGVDWGVALLAFLTLGLGAPMILLLYLFGSRLRKIGVERMDRFEGRGAKSVS